MRGFTTDERTEAEAEGREEAADAVNVFVCAADAAADVMDGREVTAFVDAAATGCTLLTVKFGEMAANASNETMPLAGLGGEVEPAAEDREGEEASRVGLGVRLRFLRVVLVS